MAKKTEEVKEQINLDEVKEELTKYVDEQIKKNFNIEVERVNKRLIREKNKKIFWKNIIIIILLALCGYLTYRLYTTSYFDKYLIKAVRTKEETKKEVVKEEKKEETKEEEKKEPTLQELTKEYGSLIDSVIISEQSDYIKEFYNGNLTTELKNYIVLNSIDIDELEIEEEYNIISDETFKEAYEKIFADDYTSKTFKYNGVHVRYITAMKSYITDNILEKVDSNIKREIVDIKVEDEEVNITTIEGIVKDKKLYNIVTNEEVEDYDNEKISSYEDSLNKVTYTFDKDGKLIKIA